jgi:ABC-2 type transport system permease protein
MVSSAQPVDISERRGAGQRIGDVVRHRALLSNLIRRELRVRYKGSVLGFFWSLLNPAMYLVVFSLVFTVFLPTRVELFGIFMLSGLLVWNFFSGSIQSGARSLIENRALVQKVWFPREVLPLASVGAGLVNLALQAIVLVVGMALFRNAPDLRGLPVLALAIVAAVLVTTGLAVMLSALTVGYRDIEHLLDVSLTAWFWMSAVVFPYSAVASQLGDREWVSNANPILAPILTFQRVLYNPSPDPADGAVALPNLELSWYVERLGISCAVGIVLIWLGLAVFARREGSFGDQL